MTELATAQCLRILEAPVVLFRIIAAVQEAGTRFFRDFLTSCVL